MAGNSEADWKHLRQLKPALLERFCSRALSRIGEASKATAGTSHEVYLEVFSLVREENQELADLFDGLSRSNSLVKILLMRREGLFTDDEWAGFSENLRQTYDDRAVVE